MIQLEVEKSLDKVLIEETVTSFSKSITQPKTFLHLFYRDC